jgi:hypothetical protein
MTDQTLPRFTYAAGDAVRLYAHVDRGEHGGREERHATLTDLIDQTAALSAEQKNEVAVALWSGYRLLIERTDKAEQATRDAISAHVMTKHKLDAAVARAETADRRLGEVANEMGLDDWHAGAEPHAAGVRRVVAQRDAATARIADLEREAEGMKRTISFSREAELCATIERMKPVVEAARAMDKALSNWRPVWGRSCPSEQAVIDARKALRAFDAGTPAASHEVTNVAFAGRAVLTEEPTDSDAIIHDLRGQVAELTAKLAEAEKRNKDHVCRHGELRQEIILRSEERVRLRAEVATLTGSLEEAHNQIAEQCCIAMDAQVQASRLTRENEKLRAEAASVAERQRASASALCENRRRLAARRDSYRAADEAQECAEEILRTPLVTDPKPREEAKCTCVNAAIPRRYVGDETCPVHGAPVQHPAVAMANEAIRRKSEATIKLDEGGLKAAAQAGLFTALKDAGYGLATPDSDICPACSKAKDKAYLLDCTHPFHASTPAPSDARPEVDDGCKHGHLLAYGCSACDDERMRERVRELEAKLADPKVPPVFQERIDKLEATNEALGRKLYMVNAALYDISAVVGDNPRVREIIAMVRKGAGK